MNFTDQQVRSARDIFAKAFYEAKGRRPERQDIAMRAALESVAAPPKLKAARTREDIERSIDWAENRPFMAYPGHEKDRELEVAQFRDELAAFDRTFVASSGQHDWIPSTLGHGETMCRHCCVTNCEAAAIGVLERCDKAPMPATAADEACEYCGPGRHTGLPGNACENCMNTGSRIPDKVQARPGDEALPPPTWTGVKTGAAALSSSAPAKVEGGGKALLSEALKALRAFDDWTNENETMFTGWGDMEVPPEAEFWRVKSGQALKALEEVRFASLSATVGEENV